MLAGRASVYHHVQPGLRTLVVASDPVQTGVSSLPPSNYGHSVLPAEPGVR